jgi:hypothetical protein
MRLSDGSHAFGPTTESSRATYSALDIAMVFQFVDRHATPNASHAPVKIERISLEWFVNM